jgi:hypothetical protein
MIHLSKNIFLLLFFLIAKPGMTQAQNLELPFSIPEKEGNLLYDIAIQVLETNMKFDAVEYPDSLGDISEGKLLAEITPIDDRQISIIEFNYGVNDLPSSVTNYYLHINRQKKELEVKVDYAEAGQVKISYIKSDSTWKCAVIYSEYITQEILAEQEVNSCVELQKRIKDNMGEQEKFDEEMYGKTYYLYLYMFLGMKEVKND